MTLWMVRDEINGKLARRVSLWDVHPFKHPDHPGRWCGNAQPGGGALGFLYSLSLMDADKKFGVTPDDHRMVIVIQRRS